MRTDFQLSDDDLVDKPLLPLALHEGWAQDGLNLSHVSVQLLGLVG